MFLYFTLCQLYVLQWWFLSLDIIILVSVFYIVPVIRPSVMVPQSRPVLLDHIFFFAFGNIFESIFLWSSRKVMLLDFLSVLSGLQASMWIHMPRFRSTCHHSRCTCSSQTHISYSCSYSSIARYSISTILSKIPETQAPVLDWIQQI